MLKLIISYGIPAESARCFPGTSSSAYAGPVLQTVRRSPDIFFTPFFSAKLLAVTCVAMCVLLRAVMTNGSSCTN